MPEPAAGSEEASRRFLTFRLDGRLYALAADEVAEVIRMPPVARVPQAPHSLLGLANLRGAVLPVASLRALLGVAASEAVGGAGARVIVLEGGAPVALAVDEVDAMVAIDPAKVETRQAALAAMAGERLSGAFQVDGRGEVARILDVRPLLAAAFTPRARTVRAAAGAALSVAAAEAETAEAARLVTFDVAGQEYGLDLQAVQEIVALPPALLVAPHAEAALVGVMPYRDTLLPLMSLRVLLGAADGATPGAQSKVMVVRVSGALVGLVTDRMRAIVPARPELVEPAPAMLAARTGGESRIKAILRGEGGRRLIAILEPEQLFREDVMQRLGEGGAMSGEDSTADDQARETLQVLVFRLGDDEFGLPIGAVDEVARAPERVTRVPKTPAFLEGVINLRGEVLPVVDQRRRFGLAPVAAAESRRLVVVRTARHRAGLLVDAVSEVLRAHRDEVEPAPDLTGEAERLVEGVINLADAGRLVLLLDPAELLTRAERGLLDAFAAETPQAPS